MHAFYKIALRISLQVHSFLYYVISVLSVRTEGGLHPKHRLMNYHAFFVDRVSPADRVLDIGCGNGALAFDLGKKAREVVAVDLSVPNIEKAKQHYPRENIVYRVADATKELGGETFDVIVLSNVLEHIENRITFLKDIRTLAPKILLRVPMIDRDWVTLYKKEMGLEWRLDPTHFTEYTEESLRKELQESGWKMGETLVRFGETWSVLHVM
jgi:2-polyprenyl-3-methyl-5-hydroxy-6-metoxy-1,4-benzoquinol methylase